jgi:phosphate:Na+ symporter
MALARDMVFGLVGGLGLFLYGMTLLGEGLRRAAGDRIKSILAVLTSTQIRGILVGAIVTAVIQSSSATSVMLVGFVNAGLMTLRQAIGVIMGANIGTTMTAQLIAFDLSQYALPAIGAGFLLILVSRRRTWRSAGEVVLGFGLLFLGLSVMSEAVVPLRENPGFARAMHAFAGNPFLGVLVGLAMTVIIQSSSATVGILMAVAIASPDVITLEVAVPILFGDNIGTCITAILASIGTSRTARRTAVVHLLFNVFGTLIFTILLRPFTWGVHALSVGAGIQRQIANAHTLFNVLTTLMWLPGAGLLERLAVRLVPGVDTALEAAPKYLDSHVLGTPGVALGLARKELERVAGTAAKMLSVARRALTEAYSESLERQIAAMEDIVDNVSREIVLYCSHLVAGTRLTTAQSNTLVRLMHAAGDVERIADCSEQLMRYARDRSENKVPVSEEAIDEVRHVFDVAASMVESGTIALAEEDHAAAQKVYNLHPSLDDLTEMLRTNHIRRLNEGVCVPRAGVIFVEVMNTLERVGDLAVNLADAVIGTKTPSLGR